MWGHYPENNNEVMISSFMFDSIKEAGYLLMYESEDSIVSTQVPINTYEDLANAGLYVNRKDQTQKIFFKISVVYQVSTPPAFDKLKEEVIGAYPEEIIDLVDLWTGSVDSEWKWGFYSYLLVADDFPSYMKVKMDDDYNVTNFTYLYSPTALAYPDNFLVDDIYFNSFARISPTEQINTLYDLNGEEMTVTSPEDTDLIVDCDTFADLLYDSLSRNLNDELKYIFRYTTDSLYQMPFSTLLLNVIGNRYNNYRIPQRIEAYKYFKENFLDKYDLDDALNQQYSVSNKLPMVTVKGFFFGKNNAMYCSDAVYDNRMAAQKNEGDSFKVEYTNYDKSGGVYNGMFVKKDSDAINHAINDNYNIAEDDSFYKIDNSFNHYLEGYLQYIKITTTVFFIIGLVMAFFAMLLLYNMISVSVSSKKQEIGILRAVGARSKDIFNIFMSETFVIISICIVLSVILTLATCSALNVIISSQLAIQLMLFIYTPVSALITIAIATLHAFMSTTLPVYKIAKKCPADSIRMP